MKKQFLLGSTALMVAVLPAYAAAEDPLRLSVGGYRNDFFGIGSIDDDTEAAQGIDRGNSSHFSDGEVHFTGETTLNNGITVGVFVSLEAFNSGDQVDEAYTYLNSDYGRLTIGSENFDNYSEFWIGTAPTVGTPINSGWITAFVPAPSGANTGFLTPALTTNVELRDDNFMLSYRSPDFAGFAFSVSYAPTSAGGSDPGDPKNAPTDKNAENHNIIGLGLTYIQTFNGVDVNVAAGYNRATVGKTAEAAGADDPQQIKIGATIGFSGFTIGGSYANEFEGQTDAGNTTSTEGQAWDLGISYSTGPWGFSLTYFHGEVEDTIAVSGDDEVDAFTGAVSFAVGPGITASLTLMHAKWDEEANVESKGTLGIAGLGVSF